MKVKASGLAKPRDGNNAERMVLILDWMKKMARVRIGPSEERRMNEAGENNGRNA